MRLPSVLAFVLAFVVLALFSTPAHAFHHRHVAVQANVIVGGGVPVIGAGVGVNRGFLPARSFGAGYGAYGNYGVSPGASFAPMYLPAQGLGNCGVGAANLPALDPNLAGYGGATTQFSFRHSSIR